jgi:hypothetical protein
MRILEELGFSSGKRKLVKTETISIYSFVPLKDIFGFKRIAEVGNQATKKDFFNANYESFETFVTRNYGIATLNSLPRGIVLEITGEQKTYEHKYKGRKTQEVSKSYGYFLGRGYGYTPEKEINTNLYFGDFDRGNGLLGWHTEEKYTDDDGYPESKWGCTSYYCPWNHDQTKVYSQIEKNVMNYPKNKIDELSRYLLEFSKQTLIATNKFKNNVIEHENNVKNVQEKAAQFLKQAKNNR